MEAQKGKITTGTSLVVQWLGLGASTAALQGAPGSIPGGGTKIPHVAQLSQKKKREREREPQRNGHT